jgi:hypothetical protein
MEKNLEAEAAIPSSVREGLDKFCQQLQTALADKLVAAILYGGLTKGEFIPEKSDVNVMAVLREITVDILDQIAPILDEGRRNLHLNLLTVTEADLADSAEVFPIKFLDIQRHHRVLIGQDVASALKVPRDRLRRQCAREIMNLQLRLRQFYLERRHRPELIESTLQRAVSTLLINLNVLVELKTGHASATKAAVIEAAENIGFDGQLLQQYLRLKRGELKPTGAELKQLYDSFMKIVQRAVELLDTV